jgi:hypothetical protein
MMLFAIIARRRGVTQQRFSLADSKTKKLREKIAKQISEESQQDEAKIVLNKR